MKSIIFIISMSFLFSKGNLLAQSYEVEGTSASLSGNTIITTKNGLQVAYFNGSSSNEKITFNFSKSGRYEVKIDYMIPTGWGNKEQFVTLNGHSLGSIQFANTNGNFIRYSLGQHNLSGNNTLVIKANFGYMYIDKISIQLIPPVTNLQLNKSYKISSKKGWKALAVHNPSTNGSRAHVWNYNAWNKQKWILENQGNGYYKIKNKVSNKALDATAPYQNGSAVQVWNYWGGNRQLWQIVSTGDGFFKILNKASGKALGTSLLNPPNGNLTELKNYTGNDEQKWRFTLLNDASTCPGAPVGVTGLYTLNGKLYDGNCNEFVMKGINHQYGDHVNFTPYQVKNAIPRIASIGKANTTRLLIRFDTNDNKGITSINQIKAAVDLAVGSKMIPVLHMYSNAATCGNNISALNDAVNRWVALAQANGGNLDEYANFKNYGVLNITNEFGLNSLPNFTAWKNAYKNAITAIRNAGYKNPIMIDAHQCGQDIDVFLGIDPGSSQSRATELLNHDPLKNMIFSVHAYNFKWNTNQEIINQINQMSSSGLTWVFGEHGNSSFQAPNNDVNNQLIWEKCATANPEIGWIAWSWCTGNSSAESALNLSNAWIPNSVGQLTTYGQELVSNVYGTSSGQIASVFNTTSARLANSGNVATSLDKVEENELLVYPNPFEDKLTIKGLRAGAYTFSLYNMQGTLYFSKQIDFINQTQLAFNKLPQGMYILRITTPSYTKTVKVLRK